MSNNAIITLASGYSFEDLKIFLVSLAKTGYDGVLYLIVNNPVELPSDFDYKYRIIQKSEPGLMFDSRKFKTGITELYSRYKRKKVTRKILDALVQGDFSSIHEIDHFVSLYHCQISRYAVYLKILMGNRHSHIFLTDSRDVYFQKEPFESLEKDGLFVFQEDDRYRIKDRWYNKQWVKIAVGNSNYKKVSDKLVYCSGTIIGDYNTTIAFLKKFIINVLKYNLPYDIKGIDQGLYNYLIHTKELDKVNIQRNQQHIMTVSTFEKDEEILVKDYIYNDDYTIPAIVHQYDRKKNLVDLINQTITTDK